MTMTLKDCIEFLESERNSCDDAQDQWYIDSYTECISHLENLMEVS